MSALELIDALLQSIDVNASTRPHFLFVTGPGGSGKTTLGENLKKQHGFVHWDADQWLNGTHPIRDSGKPINLDSDAFRNRSAAIAKAWDIATRCGFYKLFKGQ